MPHFGGPLCRLVW